MPTCRRNCRRDVLRNIKLPHDRRSGSKFTTQSVADDGEGVSHSKAFDAARDDFLQQHSNTEFMGCERVS